MIKKIVFFFSGIVTWYVTNNPGPMTNPADRQNSTTGRVQLSSRIRICGQMSQ